MVQCTLCSAGACVLLWLPGTWQEQDMSPKEVMVGCEQKGMDKMCNSKKLRVCSLLKTVSWSGAWEVFVVLSKT